MWWQYFYDAVDTNSRYNAFNEMNNTITNMMIPVETMCFSDEHDSIFDVCMDKMN